MSKVVDILSKLEQSELPQFSFEYFPPKTEAGLENLYNRIWRMSQQKPLFVDVTWGAGGSTSDLTMELCENATKDFGLEVNMHLTCTNMGPGAVEKALEEAKANGIRNICALRGDPPEGEEKWEAVEGGFTCALDLVKYIRKSYGDYFGIAVSGYPEGHPAAISKVEPGTKLTESEAARQIQIGEETWVCFDADYNKEIAYLKEKIDAGADVIITQLFYDADVFISFVDTCREAGIKAPILPGIMPIGTYGGFKRMTGFCKTRIPADILAVVEELKDNADGLKEQGLEIVSNLAKKVWESGKVPALHFYTLNQEAATYAILRNLGVSLVDTKSEEMQKLGAAAKEKTKGIMAKSKAFPPKPAAQ